MKNFFFSNTIFHYALIFTFLSNSLSIQAQEIRLFPPSNWNVVTFKSTVQPEFNLSQYNTIIIANLSNDRNWRSSIESRDIHDKISNEIFNIPGINVLDRNVTKKLLKELEFQSSGLVDTRFIEKLGQFYSAGVLLVGRIQNSDFQSYLVKTSTIYRSSCGNPSYRKAIYSLSFSFKLIDIRTTKLIYSNTISISGEKRTKAECSPSKISKQDLYPEVLDELGKEFKNLFTIHEVSVDVRFQKNRKFNDRLRQAVTYMKVGELENAYNILKSIMGNQTNKKALSSSLYNLAAFELHTNRQNIAYENAKRGYILNSKNKGCLEIVKLFQ
ncbi:hypothetical protein GTQ40_13510 [Flavobacteriaceae bacterium R38]|nr:hypothetical protein [Flavobacteriaceae bacterium R38]